jgi:hypothetical protein
MKGSAEKNTRRKPSKKPKLTPARLLEIDQALNSFIDARRRDALPVILQGALGIIRRYLDAVSVWVYVHGPRTFDKRPRHSILRFDSETEKTFQDHVVSLVADYRKANKLDEQTTDDWDSLTEKVDRHFI